jgi:N-acetylmuramoyl-L-alanine amidase CwlA
MSYTFHVLHASSKSYSATKRTDADIKYLVVHYTGNHGDTAHNNAIFYGPNGSNTRSAGAHYFVDDTEVWQSVYDHEVAWSVGDSGNGHGTLYGVVTNRNSISIEMCGTGTGTEASEATICNAVALIKELQEKFGIDNDHICRHYDVTTKKCPAWLVDSTAWAAFKQRLEEEINMTKDELNTLIDQRVATKLATLTSLTGTGDNPATWAKEAAEWAKAQGIFGGDGNGNYGWQKPMTREQLAAVLYRMENP